MQFQYFLLPENNLGTLFFCFYLRKKIFNKTISSVIQLLKIYLNMLSVKFKANIIKTFIFAIVQQK